MLHPLRRNLLCRSQSPLLTNLISHWRLDELSGAALDTHGGNTLTDNNTVTSAAGKIGTARHFAVVNTEHLSIPDNAALSMGDIDFTIACWVRFTTTTGAERCIVGKWRNTGDQREYWLHYVNSLDRISFNVDPTGLGAATYRVVANTLGAPSTATWYFIVAWHDAAANTINIQINNGTVDSAAHTLGVFNGTADFSIGSLGGLFEFFDGQIDSFSVWKRVLTSDERSFLWNNGSGRDYPFI